MKLLNKSFLFITLLLLTAHASAEVRLWLSTDSAQGNFGGRAGLDTHCDTDPNKPVVVGSTTRAFISVDANDEIRDMPSNYSIPANQVIYRRDGVTQIAANFTALLNADTVNLDNAVGAPFLISWTGSLADGSLSANHCNGWTVNAAIDGSGGNGTAVNETYLDASVLINCGSNQITYCMTYTPTVAPVTGNADIIDW